MVWTLEIPSCIMERLYLLRFPTIYI